VNKNPATITNENKNDFPSVNLTVLSEGTVFATLYFSEGLINKYPTLSITAFLASEPEKPILLAREMYFHPVALDDKDKAPFFLFGLEAILDNRSVIRLLNKDDFLVATFSDIGLAEIYDNATLEGFMVEPCAVHNAPDELARYIKDGMFAGCPIAKHLINVDPDYFEDDNFFIMLSGIKALLDDITKDPAANVAIFDTMVASSFVNALTELYEESTPGEIKADGFNPPHDDAVISYVLAAYSVASKRHQKRSLADKLFAFCIAQKHMKPLIENAQQIWDDTMSPDAAIILANLHKNGAFGDPDWDVAAEYQWQAYISQEQSYCVYLADAYHEEYAPLMLESTGADCVNMTLLMDYFTNMKNPDAIKLLAARVKKISNPDYDRNDVIKHWLAK